MTEETMYYEVRKLLIKKLEERFAELAAEQAVNNCYTDEFFRGFEEALKTLEWSI